MLHFLQSLRSRPAMLPNDSPRFRFLDLPLEIRESIYSLYFKPADRFTTSPSLESQGFFGGVYTFDLRILRVCKQVCEEARAVWTRENVFVKIATPWPSAGMYRIYLMASDERPAYEEPVAGEGESTLVYFLLAM
jgi:hypothetical protein